MFRCDKIRSWVSWSVANSDAVPKHKPGAVHLVALVRNELRASHFKALKMKIYDTKLHSGSVDVAACEHIDRCSSICLFIVWEARAVT